MAEAFERYNNMIKYDKYFSKNVAVGIVDGSVFIAVGLDIGMGLN